MRFLGGVIVGVVLLFLVVHFTGWTNGLLVRWSSLDWAYIWETDREVTVEHFAKARGFNTSRPHAVCSIRSVNEGQSYKLALNRGRACRRTVTVLVPAEKVVTTTGAKRSTATLSYVHNVLFRDRSEDNLMDWRSPNSGGKKSTVAWAKSLSLGELLVTDLRIVNLRLAPEASMLIIEEG